MPYLPCGLFMKIFSAKGILEHFHENTLPPNKLVYGTCITQSRVCYALELGAYIPYDTHCVLMYASYLVHSNVAYDHHLMMTRILLIQHLPFLAYQKNFHTLWQSFSK